MTTAQLNALWARIKAIFAEKTELANKQDSLTAGTGISIDNNVISATASGGGIDEVSTSLFIELGTYDEDSGEYENSSLPNGSSNAAWIYGIAPELDGGVYLIHVGIDTHGAEGGTKPVLAHADVVNSNVTLTFELDGVYFEAVFTTGTTKTGTVTAYKLSHLVANEENNLFIAEYGVTAYADISAAYNDKKAIFVKDGDYIMPLTFKAASGIFYFASIASVDYVWWCYVSQSNGWVHTGYSIEHRDNKKTTITDNESSNTYYPTTKAVADYAEAKTNKVTSLSSSSTDVQYPSAKAVWDEVGDINEVLDGLNGGDSGAFSHLYKMGVVSQTQTWTQASDGGYDYTMSNLVTGYIPQANIDLFESAGATFNTTTGYFEINGLTDISYKEMMYVYQNNLSDAAKNVSSFFQGGSEKINGVSCNRTNIATWRGTWNQKLVCTQISMASPLEVFRYAPRDDMYMNANCNWAFQASNRMKALVPIVNVSDVTSFNGTFARLPCFEECQLKGLKIAISIPNSPRFKASSVAYMINNAANTSAITITLHATAYARAIADSDVQAALQEHTTITLASA